MLYIHSSSTQIIPDAGILHFNFNMQDFGIFVLLMNTVASYISGFVLVVVPAVGVASSTLKI